MVAIDEARQVKLDKDRGVSVTQAARDPDVDENVLRKWVKAFGSDPVQAFCPSSVPMHFGLSRIASRRVGAATRGGGPHIEPPLLSAALARCPSELADVSMAWLLQLPRRKHVVASQLIELFAGELEKARKHLSGVRICS